MGAPGSGARGGTSPGESPLLRDEAVTDWCRNPRTHAWLRERVTELQGFPTLSELQASAAWQRHGEDLGQLLRTLHAGRPGSGPLRGISGESVDATAGRTVAPAEVGPPPRGGQGTFRIVHWNILKGVAFDQIVAALESHADLCGADVLLVNEADIGMARSGNRHIVAELGARLGMHWVFRPCYLELTKGSGPDLLAPGENQIGLHGIAILTRTPPQAIGACDLPECFDMFSFREKRYGHRAGLLVGLPGLLLGTVHLEVRDTPRCRARQMRAFLAGLARFHRAEIDAGRPPRRILCSGDLNTHTFPRGSIANGMRGLLRIVSVSRGALQRQLMEPWRGGREPLFAALRAGGFVWEGLNDGAPTASEMLARVEELGSLPRSLRRVLRTALGLESRRIDMRLDWFFGRDLAPLPEKASAGGPALRARRAHTVGELRCGLTPSDHDPIVLEIPSPDQAELDHPLDGGGGG